MGFAALGLGVPTAAADVTRIDANPGLSYTWTPDGGFEQRFGTNCIYGLTADVDNPAPVSFYDFQTASTVLPGHLAGVIDGRATVAWIPHAAGDHRITAYQTSAGGPDITVHVGTGIPLGPACFVLP